MMRRTESERFWSKVDKSGDCWVWTGAKASGYGTFGVSGQRMVGAHRRAWELTYGRIPDGLWVLHRCDNPPCVRPAHLFVGTPSDNLRDMVAKGRAVFRPLRGESHPAAKLTTDEVAEIKRCLRRGSRGILAELARRFDVSPGTIRDIRAGKKWKHVA